MVLIATLERLAPVLLLLGASQLWAWQKTTRRQKKTDAFPAFDLVALEVLLNRHVAPDQSGWAVDQVREQFRQHNRRDQAAKLPTDLVALYQNAPAEKQVHLKAIFTVLATSSDPVLAVVAHAALSELEPPNETERTAPQAQQ